MDPQIIRYRGDMTQITATVVLDPSSAAPRETDIAMSFAEFPLLGQKIAAARDQAQMDLLLAMPERVAADIAAAKDGLALVPQVPDSELQSQLQAIFLRIMQIPVDASGSPTGLA